MSAKKRTTKKNTSKSGKKTIKKVKKVSPAYVDKQIENISPTDAEIATINAESYDEATSISAVEVNSSYETANLDINNNTIISGSVDADVHNNISTEADANSEQLFSDKKEIDPYTTYPSNNNNKDMVLIVAAVVFFGVMLIMLAL